MKYRIRFTFRGQRHGYYFTEWFDTLDEAKMFVEFTDAYGELFPQAIEDENGEVV